MLEQDTSYQKSLQDEYTMIIWTRRGIIIASATALLLNIIYICAKRQFRHFEIKLFILMEIFYIISLLSVVFHNPSFDHGKIYVNDEYDQRMLMEKLIDKGKSYGNALQGFINLFCYSITYLIAIITSLYVRHIFNRQLHSQFLKKYRNRIAGAILLFFVWYLIPFIMTFIKGVPFSYGPVGHSFTSSGNNKYLLYSGIITRKQNYDAMTIIWTLFPILLLVFHIKVLYDIRKQYQKYQKQNTRSPTVFTQQDFGNSRIWKLTFLRKLSLAGVGIAVVQIFNAGKKFQVFQDNLMGLLISFSTLYLIFYHLGFSSSIGSFIQKLIDIWESMNL